MSEGTSNKGGAAEKAREVTEAIKKLDLRDRVIFLGSAALVILFFLPWWRVEVTMFGTTDSKSVNGLHEAGWIGFLAACLGTAAGLANMGFVPLSPELKAQARKTAVQLALAAGALLLGPVYFWSQVEEPMMMGLARAGKTMFFWIAFLAALAAAGAAGWKLSDERKAAGGPAA